LGDVPALAGTFVYVSNAEDGDIGMYTQQADGSLQPGQRFKAAKPAMPMAVSPDKRFVIAAVRSKPFQAYGYTIDQSSGALNLVGTGTPAESYPYIALDRSGHFLLAGCYGANQAGVNPVGRVGRRQRGTQDTRGKALGRVCQQGVDRYRDDCGFGLLQGAGHGGIVVCLVHGSGLDG
jgi:6-phosphogluconolactonase